MIYAKCIRESQITKTKEEFLERQNEKYSVYCLFETTYSHNNTKTLSCVPLNYIYDCLKYGDYIGIVDVTNNDNYPTQSSYLTSELAMEKQCIVKILKADSKEAIDYVFDNVNNPRLIHYGYIDMLSTESSEYFRKRLQL